MNTSTGSLDGCTIQPFYYQQLVGSPFRSIQVDSRRIGALVLTGMVFSLCKIAPVPILLMLQTSENKKTVIPTFDRTKTHGNMQVGETFYILTKESNVNIQVGQIYDWLKQICQTQMLHVWNTVPTWMA